MSYNFWSDLVKCCKTDRIVLDDTDEKNNNNTVHTVKANQDCSWLIVLKVPSKSPDFNLTEYGFLPPDKTERHTSGNRRQL